MSTEKSKRAIRRGNRAFVTKVIQTANDAIDKFGGTQTEKDALEGCKITLIDKKESIRKLDEAILNEIEDEEKIMEDIFQAGEVGESINKMLVKIDNVLKTVEASNVTSPGGLGTTMPGVNADFLSSHEAPRSSLRVMHEHFHPITMLNSSFNIKTSVCTSFYRASR
jgi:hypothetical protein